jgi:hypothetical protein
MAPITPHNNTHTHIQGRRTHQYFKPHACTSQSIYGNTQRKDQSIAPVFSFFFFVSTSLSFLFSSSKVCLSGAHSKLQTAPAVSQIETASSQFFFPQSIATNTVEKANRYSIQSETRIENSLIQDPAAPTQIFFFFFFFFFFSSLFFFFFFEIFGQVEILFEKQKKRKKKKNLQRCITFLFGSAERLHALF